MRVLLDECLPRRLGSQLQGHKVMTVPQAGWAGKKNGELLLLAGEKFDAFVTVDQNLPAQQDVATLPFGVVVLKAKSNSLAELKALVPELLSALDRLHPDAAIVVPSI